MDISAGLLAGASVRQPQHHPSASQMLPSGTPQSQNIQGTTPQMAPQVAAAQMNARGAKTPLPMVNPGSGTERLWRTTTWASVLSSPAARTVQRCVPAVSLEAGCATGSGNVAVRESADLAAHAACWWRCPRHAGGPVAYYWC
ncbi:hypothetical protein A0H81_07485 [Grifola frondosa]|uniref:Uncharacterized protein n=1 Tax=Grifola frondosa TaxID=5627 RepID=A0A1C7M692_GRIFR|nr:hypothetical protein A0H81_07485 [Grifola frondosa]